MSNDPKNKLETIPTFNKHRSIVRNRKMIVLSLTIVSIILVSYVALIYLPKRNQDIAYAASDAKAYSVDSQLVAANTKFAFNLFRELVVEDVNKNIFIS